MSVTVELYFGTFCSGPRNIFEPLQKSDRLIDTVRKSRNNYLGLLLNWFSVQLSRRGQ